MEGAFLGIYWAARGGESQYSAQKEWSSWQVASGMSPSHQVSSHIKNSLPCTHPVIQANVFLKQVYNEALNPYIQLK